VTSYSQPRDLEKLIIAPIMLRESIIGLIQNEIDIAAAGGQGAIWIKLNVLRYFSLARTGCRVI